MGHEMGLQNDIFEESYPRISNATHSQGGEDS